MLLRALFAFYWMSQIDGCLGVIMKRSFLVAAAASVFCAPAIWAFDLSVSVEGGDDDLTKSVRAATLLRDLRNRDENSAQDILGAARADYARVVSALYENGFYGAEVSIKLDGAEAASIPAAVAPPKISEVQITVNPGPSFVLGQADISPIAPKTDALIGFETGALASLSSIRTAAEQTIEGWRARGHAKADVARQSITARHNEAVLDVAIVIDKGPYLTFGDLSLSGASAVRAERIRAIAGLPTGAGFDPIEVELVTTRLRRAGAFDTIALVEADDANADDSLDFALQVNDRAPRRFGFGAELSSQAGAELSTFWLHRNLFGGAERLRLGARVSGIGDTGSGEDYALSAEYNRPATFNEDTDFFANGALEALDTATVNVDRFALEAGIRRYATPKRTYTFGLGLERASTIDARGSETYTLLTVPLSVTFDYRDEKLDPRDGHFADVGLTPYLGLDDITDGARFSFDGRAYKTVGSERPVTFALRAQIGALIGPSIGEAPADFLYTSGGGGTVRGQDFQSLGVPVGGGSTAETGGKSFLGLSAEARFRATDTLGVVGFIDTGTISEESTPGSKGESHSGAGIGLRYDTGIGPIRVDFAVPLDRPRPTSDFQIYIGIGQSF